MSLWSFNYFFGITFMTVNTTQPRWYTEFIINMIVMYMKLRICMYITHVPFYGMHSEVPPCCCLTTICNRISDKVFTTRNNLPRQRDSLRYNYLQLTSFPITTLLSSVGTSLLPDTVVINGCHTRSVSTYAWNGKVTDKHTCAWDSKVALWNHMFESFKWRGVVGLEFDCIAILIG